MTPKHSADKPGVIEYKTADQCNVPSEKHQYYKAHPDWGALPFLSNTIIAGLQNETLLSDLIFFYLRKFGR